MSNNKIMEEVSVAYMMSRYNLIVPEIQREYVWGSNYGNVLTYFFEDIRSGMKQIPVGDEPSVRAKTFLQQLGAADKDLQHVIDSLITQMAGKIKDINIGFLYSYRPDYYVFNDRNDDLYLIDGQQRFTTLFFMLFYFAVKENRLIEFKLMFRFDPALEIVAFDYRVRNLTHSFIIDIIDKTITETDVLELSQKRWFLSNYGGDPTIKSIVEGLFPELEKTFKNDTEQYFDYLKDRIKFWHFRTEETFQGEELYITMNSRGQQLADNETIRGKLFSPLLIREVGKDERHWSERWEIWQDFFWQHRDHNKPSANADAGLNEFLRWVQICTMIDKQGAVTDDDEDEPTTARKDILEVIAGGNDLDTAFLSLKDIDSYFEATVFLFTELKGSLSSLGKQYKEYTNFDLLDTAWVRPQRTPDQTVIYRLLPVLYHVNKLLKQNIKPEPVTLFRLIRFFYNSVRDRNLSRAAGPQTITAVGLINSIEPTEDFNAFTRKKAATILNKEAVRKIGIYKIAVSRAEVEELFWPAEDLMEKINDGHIDFFLDYTADNVGGFELKKFKLFWHAYRECFKNIDFLRGDLINSRLYEIDKDRIRWISVYYKHSDFLDFVRRYQQSKCKTVAEFSGQIQKSFVGQYHSVEEIRSEASPKKQLYIYYILNKRILSDDNWTWDNGFNFKIIRNREDAANAISVFKDYQAFAQYNKNWVPAVWRILHSQREGGIGDARLKALLGWAQS